MKFDSIKSRLLLMTIICVLGMSLLVASQHIINQKLVSLNQQKAALLQLNSDLLQLRRHEKDFLLRGQMRYVSQFSDGIADFTLALSALDPLYSEYDLDITKSAELSQTVTRYDQLFNQVVSIYRIIGLNSNQGLRAAFAQQADKLSSSTTSTRVLYLLSQAQIAHRDMLLTYEMKQVAKFEQAINQLSEQDFNAPVDDNGLTTLADIFASTADAIQQMGETESEGLRGEFRRQAHLLESRLASIGDKLNPVITQQEERVRLYSLLIAVLTCALLVYILVKSFATFHRAFSYFVMFFYQCKREFQRIDPKKLGFAEFRSLAELANEMVEARKDAERQLAHARRQLKEQEGN